MKKIASVLSIFCALTIFFGTFPTYSCFASNIDSDRIIVSLGDSYSSGEGIEPFYGENKDVKKKIKSDDWLAHRSTEAWSGLLMLPGVDGKMNKHRYNGENSDTANWYFVASSGAVTEDLKGKLIKDKKENSNKIVGQKKDWKKVVDYTFSLDGNPKPVFDTNHRYLAPQLDVFDLLKENGKQADYVTITIGGNDAGFVNVITDAALNGIDFLHPNRLSDRLNKTWKKFYKKNGIYDNLKQSYKDIESKAGKEARIIVAGYPKLIDKNGFNLFKHNAFRKEYAIIVNEAVTQFNNEISRLIGMCQNEGVNICFVSVEEKFDTHEAGSDNPFINPVYLGSKKEDIDDTAMTSAYSMHPNKKGAKVYADCVQEAIKDYEKEKTTQNIPEGTTANEKIKNEREVVLVLDESGSMDSKIDKTREAANKFVDTMIENNVRVAVVTYSDDSRIQSAFSNDLDDLRKRIDRIEPNGGTNIESGLKTATTLLRTSDASKKIIVLMSDGEANEGKQSDELIDYSNEIKNTNSKEDGIYIYTLGFFEDIDNVSEAQRVMEGIASPGCHYEITDPNDLVFFFGDIAEQINGEKNIYIRIACPVDVEVSYNDELLTSDSEKAVRTSFGNITFEENPNSENSDKSYVDDRIKILRLKEGPDYNIKITGTANGVMNYSIKFANEYGEYIDSRDFKNIAINSQTVIDTIAKNDEKSILNVDENGDGQYDLVYEAESNSDAILLGTDEIEVIEKDEANNKSWVVYFSIVIVGVLILIITILLVHKIITKRRKALIEKYSSYLNGNNNDISV